MKKTARLLIAICCLLFAIISCLKEPEPVIPGDILDGNTLPVDSIYKPSKYLLSVKIPNPTQAQLEKPVILLGHGFSATVFEWDEFRDWLQTEHKDEVLTSQILLKGHGRNYDAFKASTWEQWQESITEEYYKLQALGYKKINLAGASTSGALLLNLMKTDYFNRFKAESKPRNIFLIDPLVIPSNRFLSLISYLGRFVGFSDSGSDDDDVLVKKNWYRYYPQEALQQLHQIANRVKEGLEDGVRVPGKAYLKLYKTKRDKTVAPVSAVLIYKGLESSSGGKIDIELIDSDFHVYTRLLGRKSVSEADKKRQIATFEEIYQKITE